MCVELRGGKIEKKSRKKVEGDKILECSDIIGVEKKSKKRVEMKSKT